MAFLSYDWLDFEDIEDDWWDEYAHYQVRKCFRLDLTRAERWIRPFPGLSDEKDAYWKGYYSKVYYNLPDSETIFKLKHSRNYYYTNQLLPDELVTYEKLHSLIYKTDMLFSLWQKRLSHNWNKDIKIPWNNNDGMNGLEKELKNMERNQGTKEMAIATEEPRFETENHMQHMCPHLAMAVSTLEHFGILSDMLSPMFSDEEDSFGYYDSDEWLSLDEEPDFSDEEDMAAFERRMDARREAKQDKEKLEIKTECITRYNDSARTFYNAFPDIERVEQTVNNLLTLKNWIKNLFVFVLSKSFGRQLPHLVMERILHYLLNTHGELRLKIGFIAKTQKFIDVEKLRLRELYAAVLEIHGLFFEILFKNPLVSNTLFIAEHVKKLFQIAMRRLNMLVEFDSWLLGEESPYEEKRGFTCGMFHCKLIKSSGRDFDYLQPLNESFTSFDGKHLAILIPGSMKESCIKIYDVNTFGVVKLHSIPKQDLVLGVALKDNQLALMLKHNGCCKIEIHDLRSETNHKTVKLTLGQAKKEIVTKLMFIQYDGSMTKLLAQKEDDVILIDVSISSGMMGLAVEKTYFDLEVLAAKGQYMIARDLIKNFSSAKDAMEISEKVIGVKVFDLKSDSLLRVISQPDETASTAVFRWLATFDTDPESLNFILWKDSQMQIWKIDNDVENIHDIDLGSRFNSGTRLSLNGDIITVQCLQSSHDSNYDRVDLTEITFYEISTGKLFYHETFHNLYEKPETHIAVAGGHMYGMHMTGDLVMTLHSSTNGGEVRIYNFSLSLQKMMELQIKELMEKRRGEELKRQIKEAEKRRLIEERIKKKEEARLKKLNKKSKQRQEYQRKRQKMEEAIRTGAYVVGEISEWRGSYGFLEIDGIGTAFIHSSDIKGRPRVTLGCRIHCQLRAQIDHARPKAVSASLMHI